MYFSRQQFKPNLLTLLVVICFSMFSFRNEDNDISEFLTYMYSSSEVNQDGRVGREVSRSQFVEMTGLWQQENPSSIHAINIPKDFITGATERYGHQMEDLAGFRMHYGISRSGENVGIIMAINTDFKQESSALAGRYAVGVDKKMMGPCPHLCD